MAGIKISDMTPVVAPASTDLFEIDQGGTTYSTTRGEIVQSGVYSVNDAVSAAGTVQGDATAITAQINTITTCGTGAGVILRAAASDPIGTQRKFLNTTANNCKLYPDSGSAIYNAALLSADAATTIFPNVPLTIIRTAAAVWRVF